MKTVNLFFIALVLLFSACGSDTNTNTNSATSESNAASAKATTADTDLAKNKVEVIDFYGTHRCVTCKAIESSAKYTVDTYFADEQKKGLVVFKIVNVDEEENYDMAEKFEATGTALFLNVIKDGNETQIDLTDFAFAKGKDQEQADFGVNTIKRWCQHL